MTVAGLKQKYLFIPSQIRDPYLYHLLHNPPAEIDIALRAPPKKKKTEPKPSKGKSKRKRQATPEDEEDDEAALIPSTIIFTQRCATAHLLHLLLNSLEIPSVPLHSHLTQPQRLLSLARFRAREVPVLVTTDVGSRGLDIPEVAMVVNWDCPRRSDDYIHRVGRTARAGRGGVAVTIVTERDVELVQTIEKEIGSELVELELPEETVLEKMNAVSLARRMATMVSLSVVCPVTCRARPLNTCVGDARFWVWRETSDQQGQGDQAGEARFGALSLGHRLEQFVDASSRLE